VALRSAALYRPARRTRAQGDFRFLFDILIAAGIALVLGIGTAWYAVESGHQYGAVAVGPWIAMPNAGGPNADPYTLAMLARTGEVPLGTGEGIAFTARTDSAGEPLTTRCRYRIEGQTPPARLWTLTAYDDFGKLMASPAGRFGFHSREILRQPDGTLLIDVGRTALPGNWLPVAPIDRFMLTFRFYDTPLTASSRVGDLVLPKITRGECE
jgi:hypothetical protein